MQSISNPKTVKLRRSFEEKHRSFAVKRMFTKRHESLTLFWAMTGLYASASYAERSHYFSNGAKHLNIIEV